MAELCLALDLSSPKGSFCVFEELASHLILEKELPGTFTHSESLLHELNLSLSDLGLSLSDISKWVTTQGPGSFTGLRIAYATLKAFSLAHSRPLITVEGPEARALGFYEELDPHRTISNLEVLSYLTAERCVASSFELSGAALKKTAEKIWIGPISPEEPNNHFFLTEERIPSIYSKTKTMKEVIFPLRARHFRLFQQLSSKKVHGPQEVAGLTPLYFGSSHFD